MGPRFLPLRWRRTRPIGSVGVSTQDFFNFIQGDPSLLAGIPRLRVWLRGEEGSH